MKEEWNRETAEGGDRKMKRGKEKERDTKGKENKNGMKGENRRNSENRREKIGEERGE